MKILIIRLSAIGDTIHTLPVAHLLKCKLPGASISWMVEPASAPLLLNNPAIDQVFILQKKQWLDQLNKPASWGSAVTNIGAFWSKVRNQHFDAAIDLQGLFKSAACAIASGAPIRVGFSGAREGATRMMTDCLDVGDLFDFEIPVVEQNLKLAEFLLSTINKKKGNRATSASGNESKLDSCTVEFPLPELTQAAKEKIAGLLYTDKSMVRNVVLIPGTTWTSKIWPLESWCQLAEALAKKMNYRICLIGGPAEVKANQEICKRLSATLPSQSVLDLTGQTSLVELIPLFKSSHLVVGADTGPLHLAAACKSPYVVGVFGSTPIGRNGPYGPNCHTVALDLWCQPCFEKRCPLSTTDCLMQLPWQKVFDEIAGFLEKQETRL